MHPRLSYRLRVMGLSLCFFCSTAATQAAPQGSPQNGPRAESGSPAATKPDYSKEPFVIEKLATDLTFAASGCGSREVSLVVHLLTEEAVRQFGVLIFPYDGNGERVEVAYVRVRKPDGSVVTTPESNFQDLPSEIVRGAPTYSDLREIQIPVKALGTGDVLEYLVRFLRTQSVVPGHFWHAHNFSKDAIVLEETLRIVVPAAKYVKIKSPEIKPEIHSEDGQQIYFWKTAQFDHPAPKNQKMQVVQAPLPAVQLTTFKSWEEVGEWYGRLQSTQAAVTPAIQAKADELTKGLTSDSDKLQAIYHHVATKFRYVSISFGMGRYQPHKAEDVLSNQYGDCKDKHTLFAALLKAAGFDAWPALIGSGLKLDPDLPSPAQFNHLITVVPSGANREWLDTTPELAPYGMLVQPLRDQQALVILNNGSPTLMSTPADPPFPSSEKFEVQGTLNGDGTFTGHVDVTLRGDREVAFRTAFHQTPPTQWLAFAQNVSTAYGFRGTVSGLNVDGLDDTRKPFHYAYDYVNKHYSDWENRRIIPPFPAIAFQYGENDEQPVEPIYLGAPGEITYRATMRVPEGYSVG